MDKFIIKEIKKKITIKQVGSPGPRGEDGDPGLSATIAIGSVTSGNIPSVTNVGTENDAVFDFVLAKGDKGDNGDSSTLQNVGDGVGVWKDTVGSIASLKTIRSGSDILLLVDNDIDNTIDFNIDTRELNNVINNSFGGGAWAIGFGFEGTDTNLQFFFIRSGNYKYKVNFNQFTGNYIASDILAKQAETAISYRMTNKLDSNNVVIGIDLEFYNHNTNRGGKYSLLFSQLNQTHMFIKDQVSFSPLWGFWQNPGFTGVKDIFNLFIVDITN